MPTDTRTTGGRSNTKKKGGKRGHGTAFIYLVARRDEVLERREDGQAGADRGLVEEPGAALAARGDDLIVERARTGKRFFVGRDDVDAGAEQRGVRLCHGRGRRVVDEHDRVVRAHERRQRARVVLDTIRSSRSSRGAQEGAPVGRGRDAVRIEDGEFGRGEGDQAEGVRRGQRLQLAHELGADSSDADDGYRDGFGKLFGGGGHHGGATNQRRDADANDRALRSSSGTIDRKFQGREMCGSIWLNPVRRQMCGRQTAVR